MTNNHNITEIFENTTYQLTLTRNALRQVGNFANRLGVASANNDHTSTTLIARDAESIDAIIALIEMQIDKVTNQLNNILSEM